MTTTTKHSWTKQLGTILAAAAFIAALAPSAAVARRRAPARCGPNADIGGGVKISGCAVDECGRKGGLIEIEGGSAYCCVTSGSGQDQVKVCEQIDPLIDLIVVSPTLTFGVYSPRPFGAGSRFAR
jgi:hypothetical protein